jgi:hypothetical protein
MICFAADQQKGVHMGEENFVFKGVVHFYTETGTEGGYWAFQDERFITKVDPPKWSYEGLHILKDGDHLTIFSKENPNEIVWDGTIQLRQHDLFTEHASGLWIHADQVRVNRQTWSRWFFEGYPAQLITLESK